MSPTTVKGKQVYRYACNGMKGWSREVSEKSEGVDQMVYPIEACESSKKHSKRRWSGASHSSSCIR